MKAHSFNTQRRQLLRLSGLVLGTLLTQSFWTSRNSWASSTPLSSVGPLQLSDKNGVRLPKGFTSRIVAVSGQNLFGYRWHSAPDGGATFATEDGGWIYVSNSEIDKKMGGTGALRFNSEGTVISAYSILKNTSRNCSGGTTPWQTWLSCEEIERGYVWECDPFGKNKAQVKAELGCFRHEAIAFDVNSNKLYLTEDQPDGCLYRFTPYEMMDSGHVSLDEGFLEVAEVIVSGHAKIIRWHRLPDPSAAAIETRKQVKHCTQFNGGEGIWYYGGKVYFTTKGDNRVWVYNTQNHSLHIIYDASHYTSPILIGVDDITSNELGELLVAEDKGNMQIVILSGSTIKPLLQLVGHDQSEITGLAFSPDGSRLYFSSQRGKTGRNENGVTFEISGFQ